MFNSTFHLCSIDMSIKINTLKIISRMQNKLLNRNEKRL